MPKDDSYPISIRFSKAQLDQIEAISTKFGITNATVIRWAIEALLKYVDAHEGTLHLPVDFSKLWAQQQPQQPQEQLAARRKSATA